jgi:hypothetical protein
MIKYILYIMYYRLYRVFVYPPQSLLFIFIIIMVSRVTFSVLNIILFVCEVRIQDQIYRGVDGSSQNRIILSSVYVYTN